MAQSQRVAALPGREHTANGGTKIQHFAWRWANSVVQLPLQNSPRDQVPAETTACLLAPSPAPSCFPHPPSHKRTLSINCVCWLCFKGAWLKIVHMLSDFSLPLKASSISTQPLRIMHFFTLFHYFSWFISLPRLLFTFSEFLACLRVATPGAIYVMHLCFVVNWMNQNMFSFFAPKTCKDAIWKENLIPMNVPTRKALDCKQIETLPSFSTICFPVGGRKPTGLNEKMEWPFSKTCFQYNVLESLFPRAK